MKISIVRVTLGLLLLSWAPRAAWHFDLATGFWAVVLGLWALNSACNTILGTR